MKWIAPYLPALLVMCSTALPAQTPGPGTNTLPPKSPTYPTPAAQKWDPAIQKVMQQYETAFNKGDVKAVGALFTTNALLVNPAGDLCVGRAEFEKDIAEALAGPYKGSKASLPIGRVQMVMPDVAVVEGSFEITGVSVPTKGRYLSTMIREGGEWRIASLAAVPTQRE